MYDPEKIINGADSNKASAPAELQFTPFQQHSYPKINFPEFDTNNYRINRIMNHYKYLDEERAKREALKNKYNKLSTTCFESEVILSLAELGMVGTSLALPIIIPFSIPIPVGLTTVCTVLRSTSGLIGKKIHKHSAIELLAKSKLNSIEEKFAKAIKDGKISDEEFNDIEQKVKNYNTMKTNILNDHDKERKLQTALTDDLKTNQLEKGKVLGRTEVWDSLRKDHKIFLIIKRQK